MNTKMKLLPAIIALSLGVVACSYDAAVFEGRGQRWYARALWSF